MAQASTIRPQSRSPEAGCSGVPPAKGRGLHPKENLLYWKGMNRTLCRKRRNQAMKTKLGIVGCGFLGNIVA
ncbi:MAG: hypothetical protein U0N96_08145, partial [Faecalibacterium sp.]